MLVWICDVHGRAGSYFRQINKLQQTNLAVRSLAGIASGDVQFTAVFYHILAPVDACLPFSITYWRLFKRVFLFSPLTNTIPAWSCIHAKCCHKVRVQHQYPQAANAPLFILFDLLQKTVIISMQRCNNHVQAFSRLELNIEILYCRIPSMIRDWKQLYFALYLTWWQFYICYVIFWWLQSFILRAWFNNLN